MSDSDMSDVNLYHEWVVQFVFHKWLSPNYTCVSQMADIKGYEVEGKLWFPQMNHQNHAYIVFIPFHWIGLCMYSTCGIQTHDRMSVYNGFCFV